VVEDVAVHGEKAVHSVARCSHPDLVAREDDVPDPRACLVVGVEVREERHRCLARREEDVGDRVGVLRLGQPERESSHAP
jgi:hypothetical protein